MHEIVAISRKHATESFRLLSVLYKKDAPIGGAQSHHDGARHALQAPKPCQTADPLAAGLSVVRP